MRWCSRVSAVPRFLLASSAIHCRFVDRFVGRIVPSRVSRQWCSSRGASLPSFGSWRAQFPVLGGTMKALRPPTRVSTVAYLFRFRSPRVPPCSCIAVALLQGRRSLPSQGLCSAGGPCSRLAHTWTRMGSLRSSGDPSCAFAPFQDPGRTDVPSPPHGHVDAAPAMRTAKASAMADFGANPQLRHLLPYASRVSLPHTCKACFRLAGSASTAFRFAPYTTLESDSEYVDLSK